MFTIGFLVQQTLIIQQLQMIFLKIAYEINFVERILYIKAKYTVIIDWAKASESNAASLTFDKEARSRFHLSDSTSIISLILRGDIFDDQLTDLALGDHLIFSACPHFFATYKPFDFCFWIGDLALNGCCLFFNSIGVFEI